MNPAERLFTIPKESELRIQVDENKEVQVVIQQGDAEVFGVELPNRTPVRFANTKFAVFSFDGCKVEVRGETLGQPYISQGCHLLYTNVHAQLQRLRDQSLQNENLLGPRAIVIAPSNSGKSTLCRILTSYAARCGTTPIFVELDVDQGDIGIPGTLSASVVDKNSLSSQIGYDFHAPISYFFGSYRATTNLVLYKALIAQLSERVERACKNKPEVRAGGLIVNTPGWVDETGLTIIEEAIHLFHIGIILVIDSDVIYNTFKTKFGESLSVANIARSGGVVTKYGEYEDKSRRRRIREYFYGNSYMECPLNPIEQTLTFDECHFVMIKERTVSDSLLPIGEKTAGPQLVVELVEPDPSFQGKVLALSYADKPGDAIRSPVAGFLRVQRVMMATRTLTVLAPNPCGSLWAAHSATAPLPSKVLVVGDIEWLDGVVED